MTEHSVKQYGIVPLRVLQVICVAATVCGFIWSTGDWLILTVLVGVPVTPLSVLLMLYGTIGTVLSEAAVRLLKKKS